MACAQRYVVRNYNIIIVENVTKNGKGYNSNHAAREKQHMQEDLQVDFHPSTSYDEYVTLTLEACFVITPVLQLALALSPFAFAL